MPQSVEVTAFKQKTLEPQTKNLEKIWGDAVEKAQDAVDAWVKTVRKEIEATEATLKTTDQAISEDMASVSRNEDLQAALFSEIGALEEEQERLDSADDLDFGDVDQQIQRLARQIADKTTEIERIEVAVSGAERRLTKSRKLKRDLTKKLANLNESLNKQQGELRYALSALSLDGLRDSIGTRFWSNQVFKDFQRAYQAIAKEAGDHASLINGLKHQPISYKKALQKGISFYIDHLEVLYEAGKEAFDASEELAIAESEEEDKEVKAGKLAPPIIVFDFPKPETLLKKLKLTKEQIDRLPLKGSFSCIISDKEVRQQVAAKGLTSADLAEIGEAAALDKMAVLLRKKAIDLLQKLDGGEIDEVEATKLWRKLIGDLSEAAVKAATDELARLLDLARLDTLAKVKFGFVVTGRVLGIGAAVVGGVLAAMVGNILGAAAAVVSGVKLVTGLIQDIRDFMEDVKATLADAQKQLKAIMAKYNTHKDDLKTKIAGQLKLKDGLKGLTSSFLNKVFGYDFFATLSELSSTVDRARDKINGLEVKRAAASRKLDEVLKDQEAMQKEANRLAQEDLKEALERPVDALLKEIEKSGVEVERLISSVSDQAASIKTLSKEYAKLSTLTTSLSKALPGLKWLESTGQLLGAAVVISANQLAAAPAVVTEGASMSLTISQDVLSYGSSISVAAGTVTDVIKKYT